MNEPKLQHGEDDVQQAAGLHGGQSYAKERNDDVLSEADTEVYHHEETSQLSDPHREYLQQRHGTLELDPLPEMNDADPYNWPLWKKTTNLSLVAFHAMMATFTAAAIQSAFADISLEFSISLQQASYLTSLVIAIIGIAPLFWRPLSDRYGRRPIFLVSLICSLAGNIGCANSPSYATMALCRAITAFFICPASAIGSAVVTETFFKQQRAKYMGIWTLMVTLGVPLAPFLMGFVAYRVGYRWIYYILAITNAVQLLLYILFGPETLYIRNSSNNKPKPSLTPPTVSTSIPATTPPTKSKITALFTFTRINPSPLRAYDFIHPLALLIKPSISVPTVTYSMTFLLASIFISIEIPQLFVEEFHLNTEQMGLQYLSLIIGSVIGEQLGGVCSDRWMRIQRRAKSRKIEDGAATRETMKTRDPEFRLWVSYPGFALAVIGVVVFLVQTANAGGTWNITPLVGAAIASAGNQIVTTVMVTYAVDCYREEAGSVGVVISFVRQIWGFIGPFWFPAMIENVGLMASAGICVGLIVGVSVLPTVLLQWRGGRWR